MTVEFTTMQEALDRQHALKREATRLHAMIALVEVVGDNGNKLTASEYFRWRKIQIHLLRKVEVEIADIRSWLDTNKGAPVPNMTLMARCYRALTWVEEQGIDLPTEHEKLVSDLEAAIPAKLLLGEEGT